MDWHNQSFNRTSTATQRPPVNSALRGGPLRKIANWWHGKYVDSTLENVLGETDEGEGYVQRPAIVRASHAVGRFIAREWKWLVGFVISLLALYVAYLKL